jgi:type I restriction enzyme S subunit
MQAPKLRFQKFDSNWISAKIGDIATVTSGGTPSRDKKAYWGGDIPWVTTSEIKYKHIYDSREKITAEGLKHSSAKLFHPDTILMAMYGQGNTRGDVAKLEIEAATNQACAAIIPHDGFDADFIFQYLIGQYSAIRELSNEGGQKNLSGSIIKNISLHFPGEVEQQKIASFLSLVDQKISLLSKKHKLLIQYKKGVMQKIFNQEIRFKDKDGKEFPRWESSTIDSIATKKSSTISANKIEGNFGEYKIYGASGVLKTVDFYTEESEYVSIVKDGAGAGRAFLCEPKTSVLGTMEKVIANDGISTKFLYELLNSIDFSQFITGSTIPHVYFKDYGKSQIKLPCFDEQIKISNFLMKIDRALEIAKSQIKLTEQYKRGLLQQMFI